MRIQFFQPYHQNIYDTFRALKKKHSVSLIAHVVARKIPKEIASSPLRMWQPIEGYYFFFFNPFRLWNLIDKKSDYLVLKHIYYPLSLIAAWMANMKGVKVIFQIQQVYDQPGIIGSVLRLLAKATVRKSTLFYAQTKSASTVLKKRYKNVAYIPVCIDPSRYTLKKWQYKKYLQVIYITKFQKRKRIELLLDAIQRQRAKGRDVRLTLIAGIPRKRYEKEQRRIMKIIESHDIPIDIELNVPYDNIPTLLSQSDVFVFPAIKEPLGYSLLDAMAAGLPVIASSEVSSASYLEQGKSGYVFKADSEKALDSAFDKLFDKNRPKWNHIRSMGRRNRKIIEKDHAPQAFLKRFDQLLETNHGSKTAK